MCFPPAIIFEKIIANRRLNIYQFKQESPQRIVAMLILQRISVIFFYAVLSLTDLAGCAFFSTNFDFIVSSSPIFYHNHTYNSIPLPLDFLSALRTLIREKMKIIYAEYNMYHNSIDIATGSFFRMCWQHKECAQITLHAPFRIILFY
jgi:hypothetical protein